MYVYINIYVFRERGFFFFFSLRIYSKLEIQARFLHCSLENTFFFRKPQSLLSSCLTDISEPHPLYWKSYWFRCQSYLKKYLDGNICCDWFDQASDHHCLTKLICEINHHKWRCTFLSFVMNHQPEKAMAIHSSTLAWRIPWTEEPGRLQSMGSLRVRHDWATSLSLFTFMHWRRKWQPTPVFLPGESQGQRSLLGCRLWGHTESDTTDST